MTVTTTTTLPERTPQFERLRRRHGWMVALVVMFAVMVMWRASQLPMFAGFEVRTITAGSLAVALLAMAQGVVVMSGGRVVEYAPADDVFERPRHEYTCRLLDAVPGRG